MTDRSLVSLVLTATGPERLAAAAIDLCARQTASDVEIVAIAESGREGLVRQQLEARAPWRHAFVLSVPSASPGAVRNVAFGKSRGSYVMFVDGGENLPSGYLSVASAALDETPAAAFAAARGDYTPPARGSIVELPLLLAGPWSVAAPLFRRAALERSGGFDEALPDLPQWDLLLTLAESGAAGILLPGIAVRRSTPDDVRLRESLRAERHLPAVRRVFAKHQRSFQAHAGSLLVDRQRIARQLWSAERELLDRRERLQSELVAVMSELAAIQAELREDGRATLEWSDLRRTTPLSRNWGLERGRPVDRHYIEAFVAAHAADVRGTVLEMLDAGLTNVHGGGRVERSDVLDIDPANDRATIVADLRAADSMPSDTYDCFVLTQTLHLIDDMAAAIRHAHRILKPGGVLLATMPSVSMVAHEYGAAGDHWRVTEAGARRLFERHFAPADLTITSRGNVLASAAFLYGLACHELEPHELDADDPGYPLIVCVRAVKSSAPADAIVSGTGSSHEPGGDGVRQARSNDGFRGIQPRADAGAARRAPAGRAAVLLYHRVASASTDRYGLCIAPPDFRQQLAYLCSEWEPMPASALAEAALAGALPERAIALTFDDAYLDNLEEAAPILAEFGIPATFFATSEPLSRPHPFWWDRLGAVFDGGFSSQAIRLEIDGSVRSFTVADGAARGSTHDELYSILKHSLPAIRDDVLWQLDRAAGSRAAGEHGRPMTADEIRRLANLPQVEIGAHGVHHVALANLDPEHLFREVSECRTALERIVERPVVLFAYPHGVVSPEAAGMVRAAGYRFAFGCEERQVGRAEHPWKLPRIQVPHGVQALRTVLAEAS